MPAHIPFVEEVPVAISINGINYAVMLVSPFDLEDFLVGYLHSESVINANRDIHDIELVEQTKQQSNVPAIIANITIANRCLADFNAQQRRLKGATGCGLCGTQALQYAFPNLPVLPQTAPFDITLITSALPDLRQWQTYGTSSGALHAAFWLDARGNIQACREDIGRHNALDKLLGHLLRKAQTLAGGAVLVTSRCSVELVQKAIIAGVNNLISLASPSRLAVEMAQRHGLHLIHVPKKDTPYLVSTL